ncbi:MAG TPA: D-TA family PLP-dependent enzyme [Lunatimonas sp.]|nr:D-TA family PLP-dependent enzyme [Lunatimonas sp.]
MDKNSDWFTLLHPEHIDTPALLVYTARAKENIQKAISVVKDPKRLRPHVKTNKAVEACQLMMEAGISAFKCATIAEAEMLVRAGAKDILLAYQPVGPKQERWLNLITSTNGITFSCLVDNFRIASQLSELGEKNNVTFRVYIDLNAGTNRTGIAPGDPAEKLYRECLTLKSLQVIGFHVYDGHLRQLDIGERKKACDQGYQEIDAVNQRLKKEGHSVEVIAGGSTTFTIHAKRPEVICSPGTFIYWDQGYGEGLPEQEFEPAALVMTRIISLPAPGLICLDLGHKSISAENPLTNRVTFLNADNLTPVSQSEEHLVMKTDIDHPYQVGDVFYGIPYHICPTVALYDHVSTIEDGKKTGEWKVMARDKQITY